MLWYNSDSSYVHGCSKKMNNIKKIQFIDMLCVYPHLLNQKSMSFRYTSWIQIFILEWFKKLTNLPSLSWSISSYIIIDIMMMHWQKCYYWKKSHLPNPKIVVLHLRFKSGSLSFSFSLYIYLYIYVNCQVLIIWQYCVIW